MGFLHQIDSSKVLDMSKLRADITYNHRLQTNISLPTAQTIVSDVEFSKDNENLQEVKLLKN
ncbi:18885_t:CDS:2 [Funneliformis geosporum]|uniref:18885_t:CDS:1 n=1 Tax=Funneliformis geosporum TaxID=1117311 RepID=A0A9W4SAA8_9GLOM|nr:18885_t:CDS:2 [Funneliformis geosporum]